MVGYGFAFQSVVSTVIFVLAFIKKFGVLFFVTLFQSAYYITYLSFNMYPSEIAIMLSSVLLPLAIAIWVLRDAANQPPHTMLRLWALCVCIHAVRDPRLFVPALPLERSFDLHNVLCAMARSKLRIRVVLHVAISIAAPYADAGISDVQAISLGQSAELTPARMQQ